MEGKESMIRSVVVLLALSLVVAVPATSPAQPAATQPPARPADARDVPLTSLSISRAVQMWGIPRPHANVEGGPMRIAGQAFDDGVGMHATSRLFVHLGGRAGRFVASVGVDDAAGADQASVEFRLIGDGQLLWSSGTLRKGEPAKPVSVDLAGVQYLTLELADAGDGISGDWGNWADARFEDVRGRIVAVERLPEHAGQIVPGAAWRDTTGNLIQAHGGGILHHEGKYYWYGEDRSEGYVAVGISAYVSEDLLNWKPLGVVLPRSAYDEKWKELTIAERPKVIFNPRTKQFVMWFHYDRSAYWDSQAGVAVADRPEGPFRYLGQHRPVQESTYRDMNLFADDDGSAYAIYAGEENLTMHVVRLNDDWTAPQEPMEEGKTWIRTLIHGHREAPAVFKHAGKYYMISSAATGWSPNRALYAVADHMLGEWRRGGDPSRGPGGDITFGSQSTFVLPAPGRPGQFVYMGDRWNRYNLADARYVWLPFTMNDDGTFELRWRDSWSPQEFGFPAPDASAAVPPAPSADAIEPIDFTGRPLTWQFADTQELWPDHKRQQVAAAMNEAVALYNDVGVFPKHVTAFYSPWLAETRSSYGGQIRFRGEIDAPTAVREIGRTLGVGLHPQWATMIRDGRWTGAHALAALRAIDGPDAVLFADEHRFWPHGLDDSEPASPRQLRRHAQLVAAIREDLGIVSQPIVGRIGISTWATRAEFRNLRVTRNGQTLLQDAITPGLAGWQPQRGDWQVHGDVLLQNSGEQGTRLLVGEATWSDYTLSLEARKLAGREGFTIYFGIPGDEGGSRWNLGGWGNARHGLELADGPSVHIPGRIATGRWYDIRIEIQGPTVRAYLDGELVQQATR
jgi:hypothetical protein